MIFFKFNNKNIKDIFNLKIKFLLFGNVINITARLKNHFYFIVRSISKSYVNGCV